MPTDYAQPVELQRRLQDLFAERSFAEREGLLANPVYRADLEREIEATRDAYVGSAVTEIATLRGRLSGPLLG